MRSSALLSLLLLSSLAVFALGEVGSATPTTAAPITTTASDMPAIPLPVEKPTTQADRDAMLGTYVAQAGCVPSATCCCSTSPITVTAGTLSNMLQMSGTTDGGAGCMGQASLAGTMTMYDPLAAYTYISFVPVLMELQADPTHQTTCPIVFQRLPSATDAISAVTSQLPTGQLPTGSLPSTANLPTATLPSTAMPTATLPTATLPDASAGGFTAPAAGSFTPATLPANTALPTATTPTATVAQLPVQNADGSLSLPPATLGTGASAVTLPATTLQQLQAPQLAAPSLNSGAFGSVNSQQVVGQQPAVGQQMMSQQPAVGQQMAGPFGQLPAFGSQPSMMPNPFGSSQTVIDPTAQAQQQQQVMPGQIQPISTTTPFNTQLPLGGATPFGTNSLTAVPVAVAPGATTASNASPMGQLPAIGQIGATNNQQQQQGLPAIGSQLPAFGSQPQIGAAQQQGGFPQIGSQLPAIGSDPFSAPVNTASATPITTPGTATPATPAASLPAASSLPSANLPSSNLPAANRPVSTPSAAVGTPGAPLSSSPGSFTASAASATASAAATAAVTYTPILLEMSDSGAAPGTRNLLAAFAVPASADLGLVILHYSTMEDMRQKNVQMSRTANAELAQQLVTAAGPVLQTGSNYHIFAYGPINVASDDSLMYSYTFAKSADGVGARNSDTFSFPSPRQPTVASALVPAAALSDMGVNSASANAVDPSSQWNGAFVVEQGSCTPSDECCCGVGQVNVSTTFANPDEVLLSGMLDGGAGCLYQSTLTGLMAVNSSNALQASRSIEIPNAEKTVIQFWADLGSSSSNPSQLDQLTISNSFRSCRTVASKVAPFVPVSSSSSSELDPTDPNSFAANSSSNFTAARDNFVGEYEFDDSCVPSASCCCATGHLSIAPVESWTVIPPLPGALATSSADGSAAPPQGNRSQQIIFTTNLDGGSACVGMQNVSQAFTVANETAAAFDFPPINLAAVLSESNSAKQSGLDTVIFTNSLYPLCLSRAVKKSHVAPAPSDDSSTSTTKPSDSSTDPVIIDPLMTADETVALRDSLVGDYQPSGCEASESCCCASGLTRVRANSSSPGLLDIDTHLTGSGFSCLQKDGPVHMTFVLTNRTSAESSPFVGVNAKFHAKVNQNDTKTVIVTNTVHPMCPTTLTRIISTGGAAQSSASFVLLTLLALAAAMSTR